MPPPLSCLSILPPRVFLPWPRSLLPPSQPPRRLLPCQRRPCSSSLVLLVASAQIVKNSRLVSFTNWIFIIVKVLSSLVPTVCPPISPTSYLVMNFVAPIFVPSATSRILLVKTNVLYVVSIHAICLFRKIIMCPVLNATLLYATTTSRTAMLTVKTVNISIVNTAGYTVLDSVANVVPIDVALLALEKNASRVVLVEHMEPLTRRTM
jgi:hypothetical protein